MKKRIGDNILRKMVLATTLIASFSGCNKGGFTAPVGGSGSTDLFSSRSDSENANVPSADENSEMAQNQNTNVSVAKPSTETEALAAIDQAQSLQVETAFRARTGMSLTSLSGRAIAAAEDKNSPYGQKQNPPADPPSNGLGSELPSPVPSTPSAGGGWGSKEENVTKIASKLTEAIEKADCGSMSAKDKSQLKAQLMTSIAELEGLNPVDLRAVVQVLVQGNLNVMKTFLGKLN